MAPSCIRYNGGCLPFPLGPRTALPVLAPGLHPIFSYVPEEIKSTFYLLVQTFRTIGGFLSTAAARVVTAADVGDLGCRPWIVHEDPLPTFAR